MSLLVDLLLLNPEQYTSCSLWVALSQLLNLGLQMPSVIAYYGEKSQRSEKCNISLKLEWGKKYNWDKEHAIYKQLNKI